MDKDEAEFEFSEDEKLLTAQQAAGLLQLAPITLSVWRSSGKGPPYIKAGGSVRYKVKDLKTWLAERTIKPTAGVKSE